MLYESLASRFFKWIVPALRSVTEHIHVLLIQSIFKSRVIHVRRFAYYMIISTSNIYILLHVSCILIYVWRVRWYNRQCEFLTNLRQSLTHANVSKWFLELKHIQNTLYWRLISTLKSSDYNKKNSKNLKLWMWGSKTTDASFFIVKWNFTVKLFKCYSCNINCSVHVWYWRH